MDKMIPADGQCIPVSHGNDQIQLRTTHFNAGGKCQGTAVKGMESVEVNISRNPGLTSDA